MPSLNQQDCCCSCSLLENYRRWRLTGQMAAPATGTSCWTGTFVGTGTFVRKAWSRARPLVGSSHSFFQPWPQHKPLSASACLCAELHGAASFAAGVDCRCEAAIKRSCNRRLPICQFLFLTSWVVGAHH